MPEIIGSSEAKNRFYELLRRAEAGEVFTITHRGKLVADVIPNQVINRVKVKAGISAILKMNKRKLEDAVLDQLKRSGCR